MTKLGTNKKPAIVRVQTEARAQEIIAICEQNGWIFIVGIEPDKPEDISHVVKLMKKGTQEKRTDFTPRVSRNDYCPCGSGSKYKNCCWEKDNVANT
ncbi:MAG: SEC-C metal-binding domain-containing protein [Candidatus Latescibacter sp.]|nr:SEC-C metal-binding domain-containing protein [Candidatus Latescibacter sp.]